MELIIGTLSEMKKYTQIFIIGVLMILATGISVASDRWESAIQEFEVEDKINPPPKGATLFIGSSSFTLWTSMEEDFSPHKVINRGFGGAQTTDVLTYMDRIVLPYAPANIVFYCGGNDLSVGASASNLMDELEAFARRVHAELPDTDIYVLSVKPSPRRMNLWKNMQTVNAARQRFAENTNHVYYVDVSKGMFDNKGSLREDIFLEDRVHMNKSGYKIWINILKSHLGWSVDAGNKES